MIHTFLKSVGFRNIKKNTELYPILEAVLNHPDEQHMELDENGNEFACFSKNFGNEIGITACGNFIAENEFRMEYYYPYLKGTQISTFEPIELERHAARESYAGICDELKLGVTLIFYVDNIIDVLQEQRASKKTVYPDNAVLSALSTGGKILLPVVKTTKQLANMEKNNEKRISLMQQARDGDRNAMESLTLNDMDMYTSVNRRAGKEDVFSIVESSFIPYGIESDQYIVLGEILHYYEQENSLTGEKLWIMTLVCNELQFDVCINQSDLYGEPQIGRRFKGRIWMMGHVNYGY